MSFRQTAAYGNPGVSQNKSLEFEWVTFQPTDPPGGSGFFIGNNATGNQRCKIQGGKFQGVKYNTLSELYIVKLKAIIDATNAYFGPGGTFDGNLKLIKDVRNCSSGLSNNTENIYSQGHTVTETVNTIIVPINYDVLSDDARNLFASYTALSNTIYTYQALVYWKA